MLRAKPRAGPHVGRDGSVEPFALAFRRCHLDRGDLAAARRVGRRDLGRSPAAKAAALLRHAVARLRLAEGARGGPRDARATPPGAIANPAWNPGAASRARAARPRAARGGARVAGGGGVAAPVGLRRASSARGCAGSASCAARRDRAAPARGGRAARGHPRRSMARARLALGRSPEVPDQEALPLLRAAAGRAGAARTGFARRPRALRGAATPVERPERDGAPAVRLTTSGGSSTCGRRPRCARGRPAAVPHPRHGAAALTPSIGTSSGSSYSQGPRSGVIGDIRTGGLDRLAVSGRRAASAARPLRWRGAPAGRPGVRPGPGALERAGDDFPAAVAYPAFPDEVADVLRAASAAGLSVAPQGTGHGAARPRGPAGRRRAAADRGDGRAARRRAPRSRGSAPACSGAT